MNLSDEECQPSSDECYTPGRTTEMNLLVHGYMQRPTNIVELRKRS